MPSVVTTQPVPSSAPPLEETVRFENDGNIKLPPTALLAENTVVTQPGFNNEHIEDMLTRADAEKDEEERRRRNEEYCCFAWADSYRTETDVFCWYYFWRMYCNGLGYFCQGVSNCTESCCECCGNCLSCCCQCESQECYCDCGGGDGGGGDGGADDVSGDCCGGDSGGGDGCDCGDCDCSCF